MGGQIIEATVVPAPRQRNTDGEKRGIREGRFPEDWKDKPAKLRQKDRDARCSIKYSKARVKDEADPVALRQVDLAVPMFDYKNHVGIDRAHRLIRAWDASAANAHDGARLPDLVSNANTGSGVWADTAYRSKKNEAFLADGMFRSQIHRKKPKGRPMPAHIARANGKRAVLRPAVKHVFAARKHQMGLAVRTIGRARARLQIGMANLAYNFTGWPGSRKEVRPHERKGPLLTVRRRQSIDTKRPIGASQTLSGPQQQRNGTFFEVSICDGSADSCSG